MLPVRSVWIVSGSVKLAETWQLAQFAFPLKIAFPRADASPTKNHPPWALVPDGELIEVKSCQLRRDQV